MLTSMRQIGNSRGVLIPAAFLASCQIEDQVDMQLQDGQIVIKPITRKLRDGWFFTYKRGARCRLGSGRTGGTRVEQCACHR